MRIPFSSTAPLRLAAVAAMLALGLSAAGCSSHGNRDDRPENPFKTAAEGPGGTKSPLSDRELRQQAQELYRHAREALENADYQVANTRYDALIARYPFSDYSTQAELEKIYTQYKSYQFDEAVTAADRFMRAHPRHPHADYVLYIKGVADFNRDDGLLDTVMPGNSKRDIGNQRRAFEDFALLVQRYPTSRYASDARRRMLYARNRIADHELSVAQFYMTRGAYVAAAKRATDIITEYPGAPATAEALRILQRAYARTGLEQEAKDAATVIAMNSDTVQYTDAPKPTQLTADPGTLPPEAAADKPPQRGLMSRVAGVFGVFDSSKPENQHTYVVGGDKPAAQPAAPAPGASAAPSAGDQGSGLHLSSGFNPDTAPPAAAANSKAQPDKPDAATQDKAGFFTWFAHLFDFAKHDEPPDTKPSPRSPPPPRGNSGSTNADTTK